MRVHVGDKNGSMSGCLQSNEIDEIKTKIEKIDKTLFFSNGRPSVLTQLAVHEQTLRALMWLVCVTCASVIGQIVFQVFANIRK